MPRKKLIALAAALILGGGSLAACGSSAPTTAGSADDSRGPITFASGKDFTKEMQTLLDKWNTAHPQEKVTMLELAASPDEQRTSFVQNFQAKSSAYDVLWSDVVWTSEFAARGWIEELDPKVYGGPEIMPAAVKTAMYNGKMYGAPFITNGGLLFYRSDLVKTPPKTWAELFDSCRKVKPAGMDCYAGQFSQYEGLTVNAAEAINAAGGKFLGDDGKTVAVDSPEARAGLQVLVTAFKDGLINKEAITYKEEESRRAFVEGRLMYLRNWPYVYTSANEAGSAVKGKFGITTLPGATGPGRSSLGGIDLVVSKFSKHKQTAKDWIAFMQSEASQRSVVKDMNQASVRSALYDDPELVKASPYLPTLKDSILGAQPRPATPNYNAVSLAIQKNAYAALQGQASVDQAVSAMADELRRAVG
ncbi:MAG TPA: ABC transporter substrate-binding protein [Intrasporangium sp.]|uniref:ABC transporter substrate-binding protein n=1 Tax=Intrasporangium sp. TaxID=1925024 RepID=UPI002D799EA8|nr:ABC transporter substrate-binding protein [Intrasporangium sp.]HET7398735.1 ABC transporter substrate-binding protein [Intrasporangium sp.]